MRIAEMNWKEVEAYLAHDDRCVVPLGSTEQHAQLSLAVDSILSERVAVEAAEPLGVPVFPGLAYGLTPYFTAYPGTVSLRLSTYQALNRGRAGQPCQHRLSSHPVVQRARRQRPGRRFRDRVDGAAPRVHRAVP